MCEWEIKWKKPAQFFFLVACWTILTTEQRQKKWKFWTSVMQKYIKFLSWCCFLSFFLMCNNFFFVMVMHIAHCANLRLIYSSVATALKCPSTVFIRINDGHHHCLKNLFFFLLAYWKKLSINQYELWRGEIQKICIISRGDVLKIYIKYCQRIIEWIKVNRKINLATMSGWKLLRWKLFLVIYCI